MISAIRSLGALASANIIGLGKAADFGFQILMWYRIMRFFDACRVPLAPRIVARLIRHVYSADIHWKTRIAPGVSIVHGMGLVLGHGAEVGEGSRT